MKKLKSTEKNYSGTTLRITNNNFQDEEGGLQY